MAERAAKRRSGPVVFAIGFPFCGGDRLIRLFRRNGYGAVGGLGSKIAENILYARQTGAPLLRPWKHATAFADLEGGGRFGVPALEAYREFRFLHERFPDAVFVLNTCDPARWLARRAAHLGGMYAEAQAARRGVDPRDLPDVWMADWRGHLDAVVAHFGGHAQFLRHDFDRDDPEQLRQGLRPWYDLPKPPSDRGGDSAGVEAEAGVALQALRGRAPVRRRPVVRDADFEAAVVAHCVGPGVDRAGSIGGVTSRVYAHWDGRDAVVDASGRPLPMARVSVGGREVFLAGGDRFKIDRLQGVLNDILGLGRTLPVRVDMEDARKYGLPGVPNPAAPLLAYNRRAEARGVVLWPLPVYHAIGNPLFALPEPTDPLAFDQKADAAGWRGKLAGRAGFHDGAGRKTGRSSAQILGELLTRPPPVREAAIAAELQGLVRYRVVQLVRDNPRFDMQLTLMGDQADLADHPLFAGLCGERRPPEWFYRYRYVPCLSGYDTGSNFFVAASSNSVVLKEEDGWELFYTAAFTPWEHYVPLARGAADLEEKLDWARAHPVRCKDMVRASQAVCRKFADPSARARILLAVLEAYAAM